MMGEITIDDARFFTIQAWMTTKLKLPTIERDIFAVIYGFSQNPEARCYDSLTYLAGLTGHSRRAIIDNLNSLVNKGYIIKTQENVNGVIKNRYHHNSELISKIVSGELDALTGAGDALTGAGDALININKINKTEEVKGKPFTPAELDTKTTHSRNFRKEIKTLSDDLNSLGELEEKEERKKQKAKEKKKTLYEKCIDAINDPKYGFRDDVKQSLRDFLPSTLQATEFRVSGVNQWKYRLDALTQFSKDPDTQIKIIAQSISNSLTGFRALGFTSKKSYSAASSDSDYIIGQTLSPDEARALLDREAEENGVI